MPAARQPADGEEQIVCRPRPSTPEYEELRTIGGRFLDRFSALRDTHELHANCPAHAFDLATENVASNCDSRCTSVAALLLDFRSALAFSSSK